MDKSKYGFIGFNSIQQEFISKVKNEFVKQPLTSEEILTEADIAHLPSPVRKYIAYTGAIGKSKPQNVRIEFDAQMTSKPGADPMKATSVQYNFYGDFTRLFFMKASKFFIPFRVLHTYIDRAATMVVRVASLFNAVDITGEELTAAETVTLLNDMCVFVPGSLFHKQLNWQEIDDLSARVTIENGSYQVSAVLYFNDRGELANFISEDRYALQDDGTQKKVKWSTPIANYQEIDGRKIPTDGEVIWNYPGGDFTYGKFTLKDIKYNIEKYAE
jgi:hypothetical protein